MYIEKIGKSWEEREVLNGNFECSERSDTYST